MTRTALLLVMLTGFCTSQAWASKVADAPGEMTVKDPAGLFTPEGIAKAKEKFTGTTFHGPVRLFVHAFTESSIPGDRKAEFAGIRNDKDKVGRYVNDWAKALAKADGAHAVVILLVVKDDYSGSIAKAWSDSDQEKYRHMTEAKLNELCKELMGGVREVRTKKLAGEARHAAMDKALFASTQTAINDLKDTTIPDVANVNHASSETKKSSNIMGYVCLGLCVLLGIWLVVGLIRAFTGGGGGGYGGGGFGGGMGGGGGGFFTSLIGGMFGAAAGMWMYNHFLGGGMNSLGASESTGGDYSGGGDTAAAGNDYDNGGNGGDNDWGGSGGGDAGGDWGGDAGGDWGGGGDMAGGDW